MFGHFPSQIQFIWNKTMDKTTGNLKKWFCMRNNPIAVWIFFLGIVSLSEKQGRGVPRRGGGGVKKFVTNLSHLTPKTCIKWQSFTTFKLLIINCYLLQVIVNTRLLIRWSGVRDPADPPALPRVCWFATFSKNHLSANLSANYPYNFLDMAAPVSKVSSVLMWK